MLVFNNNIVKIHKALEFLKYDGLRLIYFTSAMSKVVTMINQVILIPLVAVIFSPDDFAKFAIALSIAGVIISMDVGIGGGTLNRTAVAFAKKDFKQIYNIAFTAYSAIAIIILTITALAYIAETKLGWFAVIEVALNGISEVKKEAWLILLCFIASQALFQISIKILQGIKLQAICNLIGFTINLIQTGIYLRFLLSEKKADINALLSTILLSSTACSVAVVIGVIYIIKRNAQLAPQKDFHPKTQVSSLFTAAMPFLIIAIAAAIEREGLKWAFATIGDLQSVARLAIYSQVIFACIGLVQMFVMPFWPILINAKHSSINYHDKLSKGIRSATYIGSVFGLLGIASITFGEEIAVRLWGSEYGWEHAEFYTFGGYVICSAAKHTLFPILVGIGRVKTIALCYSLEIGLLISGWFFLHPTNLSELYIILSAINLLVSTPTMIGICLMEKRNVKNEKS